MSQLPPGITPDDDDVPTPHPPLPPRREPPKRLPPDPPPVYVPAPARPTPPVHRAFVVAVLTAFFGGAIFGVVADAGARYAWQYVQTGPPGPAPIEGKLWVTLIYDADNPGTTFARMESDPGLKSGIEKLGGHLRKFAKDSETVDKEGFRPYVDKFGVPTLIVEAEGSSKVLAEACPKLASEVVEAARKFKGGKK